MSSGGWLVGSKWWDGLVRKYPFLADVPTDERHGGWIQVYPPVDILERIRAYDNKMEMKAEI